MSSAKKDNITRFDLTQRIQHLLLIVSFTTLAITGLLQLLVRSSWAQQIMHILGDIDGVRRIHHVAGVLLLFVLFYHVVSIVWDIVAGRSVRMLPRLQDVKDAIHSVNYLLGRRTESPKYDRFDFKQKMEYWALIWGTFLMVATGLILMFPQVITQFVPGVVVYAAKAAHGLEALLAIVSIITWHMYSTHFAEGMWPLDPTIFSGKISRERMLKEHPLEYERLIEAGTLAADQPDEKLEGK
jgi:formate dehydrogenase gamma subunit